MTVYKDEQYEHVHPLTTAVEDTVRIFSEMGVELATGPHIENEKNNFDDLNIPPDHPSRDLQDTFWLRDQEGMLLRTHTTAHQVPYLREHEPPVRMFSCGRVFRNERTDVTHEVQFYQVEGLMVDERGDVTMAHLKGALETYIRDFFGKDFTFRLRPGYFPFVEPGVEMDIQDANGKWLEILGAGMVHPNVLAHAGYDSETYAGFAFGAGLDRLVMLRHGIDDVRHLYNADVRFVNQF